MKLIPDNMDFNAYMQETEMARIRSASEFADEVVALFYPPADAPIHPFPMWLSLIHI